MQQKQAKLVKIHTQNPQMRLVEAVVDIMKQDGVVAYPTDSGYALGCQLTSKKAFDRMCAIRKVDRHHNFTLMLTDLSNISHYARLNNAHFRLLKQLLPGGYTFILPSTRLTPSALLQQKRKTIGIRISTHPVVQAMLTVLNEPLASVSLILDQHIIYNADDVYSHLNHQVDIIIDAGYCPPEPTTVVDLSQDKPQIIRQGSGNSQAFNTKN